MDRSIYIDRHGIDHRSGLIAIIPKPELMAFWGGDSLTFHHHLW